MTSDPHLIHDLVHLAVVACLLFLSLCAFRRSVRLTREDPAMTKKREDDPKKRADDHGNLGSATVEIRGRVTGIAVPSGPWDTEPDAVSFTHAGYPCELVRSVAVFWTGHLRIPNTHPWVKRDLEREQGPWSIVHGGVSYQESEAWEGGYAVIGFDCGHRKLGDLTLIFGSTDEGSVYRDLAYARRQLEILAEAARRAADETAP